MASSDVKVFYVRESLIQSILADLFSGLKILSMFAVNSYFIHSGWLDFVITLIVIFVIFAKKSDRIKKFNTNKELIEYLNKPENSTDSAHGS